MFNPLRLFRRADHIDEAADAYVEGRATERDLVELRSRAAAGEQGLIEDLDSIRSTVSLLRSIEPASAPRSFALAEAPVQVRIKRSRMAMAPAVFAIAAAAMVGLLAVGNLADVVRQSDSGSDESPASAQAENAAMSSEDSGSDFDPVLPGGQQSGSGPQSGVQTGEGSLASDPPARSAATATVAPASGGSTGDSASSSSGSQGSAMTDMPEPSSPPVGEAVGALPESVDPMPGGGTSTLVEPSDAGAQGGDPGFTFGQEDPKTTDDGSAERDMPAPLPLPTSTNLFDQDAPIASIDTGDFVAEQGDEEAGVPLPIWQLQLGFAIFAVVMAGAWMLLQRRLTA